MSDDLLDSLPEPSFVCRLVAEGLERVDQEGLAAVDRLCEDHPEHAEEIRRRMRALCDVGLVDDGRSFGHYRVVRTLGRGGMGVVYLARDERLDRLVALKALPERLVPNDRARERLQREIRAVAQLQHPAVVPIFDVGEEAGAPYFTMEWIEGLTLAELLDRARQQGLPPEQLSAEDLLAGDSARSWIEAACRLVLSMARGLHHAHEHGVVHRDVKPQNIMVGADGRARLFDFGLARLQGEAGLTLTGDLAGTPFYLSPEAASSRRVELDARTDVYSLGVTLFELLTLRVPFTGQSTAEVLRQISLREPPLPRKLNAEVSRDLETVCLTAMEKEPDRRYDSAAAFADDLQRLLAFRPVLARPVGPLVRALRSVRRRPALAAAVALSALVLVGTPVLLGVANRAIAAERDAATTAAHEARAQGLRAEAESQRAHAEARAAEAARAATDQALQEAQLAADSKARAVDFLLALLSPANPWAIEHDLQVVDILRRGAAGVGQALEGDARLEASVRQSLGLALMGLGQLSEAGEQFELAWALADDGEQLHDDLVAVSANNLMAVHSQNQRFDEALEVGQLALTVNTRLYGEHSLQVADVVSNLAIIANRKGWGAQAEELFRHVLQLRTELLGEDAPLVAETLYNLGLSLADENLDEKQQLMERALAIQRLRLPEDDPVLSMTLGGLAQVHYTRAEYPQAIELQEEELRIKRLRLGEQHWELAPPSVRLAFMYVKTERFDLAEAPLRLADVLYSQSFPDGVRQHVTTLRWLATVLAELQRPQEAEPFLLRALEMQPRVSPDDGAGLRSLRTMQVDLLQRLERDDEAQALLDLHPDVSWPASPTGS